MHSTISQDWFLDLEEYVRHWSFVQFIQQIFSASLLGARQCSLCWKMKCLPLWDLIPVKVEETVTWGTKKKRESGYWTTCNFKWSYQGWLHWDSDIWVKKKMRELSWVFLRKGNCKQGCWGGNMPSSLTGGAGIEQARGTVKRGQMGEIYRPSQAIVMTGSFNTNQVLKVTKAQNGQGLRNSWAGLLVSWRSHQWSCIPHKGIWVLSYWQGVCLQNLSREIPRILITNIHKGLTMYPP